MGGEVAVSAVAVPAEKTQIAVSPSPSQWVYLLTCNWLLNCTIGVLFHCFHKFRTSSFSGRIFKKILRLS